MSEQVAGRRGGGREVDERGDVGWWRREKARGGCTGGGQVGGGGREGGLQRPRPTGERGGYIATDQEAG